MKALEQIAKKDVAIYEHVDGRKVYVGHKPTDSACIALDSLAAIAQVKG